MRGRADVCSRPNRIGRIASNSMTFQANRRQGSDWDAEAVARPDFKRPFSDWIALRRSLNRWLSDWIASRTRSIFCCFASSPRRIWWLLRRPSIKRWSSECIALRADSNRPWLNSAALVAEKSDETESECEELLPWPEWSDSDAPEQNSSCKIWFDFALNNNNLTIY